MSGRPSPLNSSGDTIIEVLMAVAIMGAILVGAYVSAGSSFNSTQLSKERDIALRVAETQMERIRGYKATGTGLIGNNTCVSSVGVNLSINNNNPAVLPELKADTLSGYYTVECIQDSTSQKYVMGTSDGVPFYINNQVSTNDYTVHVRWPGSGSGGNQEVIIKYRAY